MRRYKRVPKAFFKPVPKAPTPYDKGLILLFHSFISTSYKKHIDIKNGV
jgi:hypothetical protein